MLIQVKAWRRYPSLSSSPTGPPLLDRLRGRNLVTRRHCSYAALRLPCCLDRGSGFPSSSVYHGANAFLNRSGVRSRTPGASEAFGYGASVNPARTVDSQGPPRLLGRPLQTCRGRPPRLGKRRLAQLR